MKALATICLSILAVAGTALSTSCWTAPPQTAAPEPVEMKIYTVPASHHDQARSMLRYALGGDNPIGKVSTGPGNSLVVVAPPKVHEGVATLIQELGTMDTSSEHLQVTTAYWMIVGRPLKQGASGGRGYVVEGDSSLDAVAPALETIVATQGPTEFSLMEHVQITALNTDRGRAHGRNSIIEQRLTDIDGRITGDVSMIVGQNQIDTRIAIEPGQILVMGQVGYRGRVGDVFETDGSSEITLYYVMARK